MMMRLCQLISLVLGAMETSGDSVMERLSIHEHFSKFSRLLSSIEGPHTTYLNTFVTVFAPTNAAMETYTGARDLDFILNHFVSTSVSPEEFGGNHRLSSLRVGQPPLWVRKIGKGIFINQARVIRSLPLMTDDGKSQYLYLIDSVLKSVVPNV